MKTKKNKNMKVLEENELTPIFYKYGDATVCLLRGKDESVSGFKLEKRVIARGLSIHSPTDVLLPQKGHSRALGMAVKAFINQRSGEVIRDGVGDFKFLNQYNRVFYYRSTFIPAFLLHKEQKMLDKRDAWEDRKKLYED